MAQTSLPMQLLLLIAWVLLPGCWAVVNGPGSILGFQGTTISVNFMYKAGQEKKPKFWCSPATIFTCSDDIVITSKLQPVVRQGRVSIQDNRARRVFTVTIENLTKRDAGIYLCGVRTNKIWFDEHVPVEVIVASASMHIPAPTLPPTTPQPPTTGTDAPQESPRSFRYFPVLAGLQLLVLLPMSGVVLWVSLRG
ncbi:CMRF-35-like molecule 4 [Tyto alba]|uniref:CMRF-35-like molecule 4 n=1 Tax=Tyto alba TaxID=56313 RepID=UPI001C66861A|nr:CMRF-35-like molecule 4 [Tyto alba]